MMKSLIFKRALYWASDFRAITGIGSYNFSTSLYFMMTIIDDLLFEQNIASIGDWVSDETTHENRFMIIPYQYYTEFTIHKAIYIFSCI